MSRIQSWYEKEFGEYPDVTQDNLIKKVSEDEQNRQER